jgi:hypothetical protein
MILLKHHLIDGIKRMQIVGSANPKEVAIAVSRGNASAAAVTARRGARQTVSSVSFTTWQPNIIGALRPGWNIILFPGGTQSNVLLNTILIGIVYQFPNGVVTALCNTKLRDELNKRMVVVSLGSACNKGAASYVVAAMRVPPIISRGIVRISMCDSTTKADLNQFLVRFAASISALEHTIY